MSAPTFADLCEAMRRARRKEMCGIARLERAEAEVREAKGFLIELSRAEDLACGAIDDFIQQEAARD